MTWKTVSLSALAVCLCIGSQCAAQDFSAWIAPTIRLSSEETAAAKQATEELKTTQDRATAARANWVNFQKEFARSHPEVAPYPKFSSDFTAAYSVRDHNTDAPMATVVELSAEEHQKAEAVYAELKASYDARQQAEKNWNGFQSEFLVKHVPGVTKVPSASSGAFLTLPTGETYTIPAPWGFGIALTPDFRTAVPRGT